MPVIPDLREQGQLRSGNPTPIGGPNAGALLGEEIQGAGAGLAKLGAAMHEQHKITQAAMRALDAAKASQDAQEIAIQIQHEVLKQGSTNGDEHIVFQDAFDKATRGMGDNIDDEYTQTAVKTAIKNIRNDTALKLSAIGLKNRKDALDATLEGITRKGSAIIRSDGSKFESESLRTATELQRNAGILFNESELPKKMNDMYSDNAQALVTHFMDQGKYKTAREVLAKRAAPFLSPEKASALRNEIDRDENSAFTRQTQETQRADRAAKERQEEAQKKTFATVLEEAYSATDPQSRWALEKRLEKQVGLQIVSPAQSEAITRVLKRKQDVDDGQSKFNLMQDALAGRNLGNLERITTDMLSNGMLNPDSAIEVLRVVNKTKSDKSFSDPKATFARTNAKQQLLMYMGYDSITKRFSSDKIQAISARVLSEWTQRVLKDENPDAVTKSLATKYLDPAKTLPLIQGIPQLRGSSIPGIEKQAKQIDARLKQPGITQQEKNILEFQLRQLWKNKKIIEQYKDIKPSPSPGPK